MCSSIPSVRTQNYGNIVSKANVFPRGTERLFSLTLTGTIQPK
jgi:hypothetical protein